MAGGEAGGGEVVSRSTAGGHDRALAQRVLERAGADELKRPRVGERRGRVEEHAQALLAGEPAGVDDVILAADLGARAKSWVKSEAQPQRRVASRASGAGSTTDITASTSR